jgi:hypothetical protein
LWTLVFPPLPRITSRSTLGKTQRSRKAANTGGKRFKDYVFNKLDPDAPDVGHELVRIRGLILALARKTLEQGRFMSGLSVEQREVSLKCATAYYKLARGFYSGDALRRVEAAWTVSIEHGEICGWPTVIFEILAPQKIFRDTDVE